MPDPLFASALLGAAVVAVGAWLVVCAVLPRTIRLGDAFGVLAEARPGTSLDSGPALVADATSRLELSGAWLYQHARLPLPAGTARTLVLTGRTVGDYFCNKLVLAAGGLLMPWLLALAIRPLTGGMGMMPAVFGLGAAVLGWFWPDIAMRSSNSRPMRMQRMRSTPISISSCSRGWRICRRRSRWRPPQESPMSPYSFV